MAFAQSPLPRLQRPDAVSADGRLAAAARSLERAAHPEVTLRLSVDDGRLLLDLVKVEPEARGMGLGRQAMRGVLWLADVWGVPVTLYALSLAEGGAGPDQAGLEAWYARLGFARTGALSVMGLAEMRRPPCAARGAGPQPTHKLVSSHRRRAC